MASARDMDLEDVFQKLSFIGIQRAPRKAPTGLPGTRNRRRAPESSRLLQNFVVVWLDSGVDGPERYDRDDSFAELRRFVNTTRRFTNADQCMDFVSDIGDEKVFLILSEQFTSFIMPLVHDIVQISSIYILGRNQSSSAQGTSAWLKVKGSYPSISSLSETIRQDAYSCDQNCIVISIVDSRNTRVKKHLDELDPTFMYTQILKEIMLDIEFKDQHIKSFAEYYRQQFADNAVRLEAFQNFEREYRRKPPTWWYTHECCLYSLLNRALRTMEVDILIKMGFLIRDLHRQIADLHGVQFKQNPLATKFTVYRGQCLSRRDFQMLSDTQGGLVSFNNFLSTSRDPEVAFGFARSSQANPTMTGVVFKITIDPSLDATPFASIKDDSYYKKEDEILFSMHSVFRIGNMELGDKNGRLWHVDLFQTNDSDKDLNRLMDHKRGELSKSTGWDRLGKLLIKLNQYEKAQELYEELLDQVDDDKKKMQVYHQLGWAAKKQDKCEEALEFYERELELRQKILPENDHRFADSYKEIGSVYEKMKEYSQALLYYEEGLFIQMNSKPRHPKGLAVACSNIASVYEKMKDYPKALEFLECAIKLREKLPPEDRPTLAYSYNNRGSVYEKMGNYEKAIESHQKALAVQEQFLPPFHPDLAQTHSNIGFVYSKMHDYAMARQSHQKSVDFGQRSLTPKHPRLLHWKRNLDSIKRKC